jgi:hypothetical protein
MSTKATESSDEELNAADAHHLGGDNEHDQDTGGHDHDEMHSDEHAEPALGPIDWGAWGVSLLGVGLGGVIALALFLVARPA